MNEPCWLQNESRYEEATNDGGMEWSGDHITSWYSETFKMGKVLQDLHDGGEEFSSGRLPLCRSCFDRTFNYVNKTWRRCQGDAYELQKFLQNLHEILPRVEQKMNRSDEESTEKDKHNEDNKEEDGIDQETLERCNAIDAKEHEKLNRELDFLQKHVTFIKEKQQWVQSEIQQELIKIRDLEYQELQEISDLEDLNYTLFSMMAENDYLEYLLSKPRLSPLVTISSSPITISPTNKNIVYIVNNSRLSFDCCPEENLNWQEINSAWTSLVMGMKAVENILLKESRHNRKVMEIADAIPRYKVKPMRAVSIIHGGNSTDKAYALRGYGKAIENKGYLRAILAFAIYVKQICQISQDVVGTKHPLRDAPVEKMFESIARGGPSKVSTVHMQSVVFAIVKCAKLFQIR